MADKFGRFFWMIRHSVSSSRLTRVMAFCTSMTIRAVARPSAKVQSFEIGNALSAMLKRRRLEPDKLLSVWDATQQIPVDLRNVDIREALKMASQFNIYAYDAYFLVCAISLHSPLITLDRRMNEVAQSLGSHIMEVT